VIVSRLQEEYGLHARQLTFLPLGADVNTAVYRAVTIEGAEYFVKLRKGDFNVITAAIPRFLKSQGLPAIIAPLETKVRQLWAGLGAYKIILYPFIDGKDGYEVALTDQQWLDFGATLKGIHSARLPPVLSGLIPCETYTPHWRNMVKVFQAQVEEVVFDEPTAAKLAVFMKARRDEITRLVALADRLASELQALPMEGMACAMLVLCHSDIHPGNLLINPGGSLYIVDWDNPIFAPKERDLMHVGGSSFWHGARIETLFYLGYGPAEIDRMALAYYRSERVIQDIAEFCRMLLLSTEGGKDREQWYRWFTSQFLPGHEIEIAFNTY
jgi:spectinomycin phosphotransferase